jgi:hypothetical protein
MFSKSSRTPEPSFYYVLLAAACFRRTAGSCHSNADGALRELGCKYLATAGGGVAHEEISELSLPQISRTGDKTSWRQPWTVY